MAQLFSKPYSLFLLLSIEKIKKEKKENNENYKFLENSNISTLKSERSYDNFEVHCFIIQLILW